MQLGIGLVFAVLLTFMKKHVTFVKTLYYVPCIITTVAIAQLFRSMYATEPMGLINQFFQAIGMEGMVTSCIRSSKSRWCNRFPNSVKNKTSID